MQLDSLQNIKYDDSLNNLTKQIINFSNEHGNLLDKYDDKFLLNYFDSNKIKKTLINIRGCQKQLRAEQFLRIMLNIIEHEPTQTLYLSINIINLYYKLKGDFINDFGVKFADFTSYLCQKICNRNADIIIPIKKIPIERSKPDLSRIREIDLNAPEILLTVHHVIPKISKDIYKKDRKLAQNKTVAKFIYSNSLKSIFTLGRLSSCIDLFDLNLKSKLKIVPSQCLKMLKDVAILSIAYCEKLNRIGAIINNIGINFWQGCDFFKTEKSITKFFGDKIYYLDLFDEWITTDQMNIYYWNIKQQQIKYTLTRPTAISINDICQITHLRSLCVSYTDSDDSKSVIIYHQNKQIICLNLDHRACHTVHYDHNSQMLLLVSYQIVLPIYQIEPDTFNIHVVAQLKGHSSIITSIGSMNSSCRNVSLILTGDDTGEVRLWELNTMRCLQVIKVSRGIQAISCVRNKMIFMDGRLNILEIDNLPKQNTKEQLYALYKFYEEEYQNLWIVTRKDIRCLSLMNGQINKIIIACNEEQEISSAVKINNGFIIGSSKGIMMKFNLEGNKKWTINAHEDQISRLKYDSIHKFIFSVGLDGWIHIWPQKIVNTAKALKSIDLNKRHINLFEISFKNKLLMFGSTESTQISIWNYEIIKLQHCIHLKTTPTIIQLSDNYKLLIIINIHQQVNVFTYHSENSHHDNHQFYLKLIYQSSLSLELISKFPNYETNNNSNISIMENKTSEQINIASVYIDILSQSTYQLYLGSTNGIVIAIQLLILEEQLYPKKLIECQESPSMHRPSNEDYNHQLLKKKYTETVIQPYISQNENKQYCKPQKVWCMNLHKQNILHLQIINLSCSLLSSLCNDGYIKFINIENCQILGSVNINHPLPIKWNLPIASVNENYLRKKIYEALVVIDSLIQLEGYQMTKLEYSKIQVMQFLSNLKNLPLTNIKTNDSKVAVLRSEYTEEDLQGKNIQESSLKALEVYKRVKLIQQHKSSPNKETKEEQKQNENKFMIKKKQVQQWLDPNYFPKLLNKNISTHNGQNQLLFNSIRKRHEKHKSILMQSSCHQPGEQFQNKKKIKRNKMSKNQIIEQVTSDLRKSQEKYSINTKPIKNILLQIKQKLDQHKKAINLRRNL